MSRAVVRVFRVAWSLAIIVCALIATGVRIA